VEKERGRGRRLAILDGLAAIRGVRSALAGAAAQEEETKRKKPPPRKPEQTCTDRPTRSLSTCIGNLCEPYESVQRLSVILKKGKKIETPSPPPNVDRGGKKHERE